MNKKLMKVLYIDVDCCGQLSLID